jgi:hypothetical protein
VGVCVCVWGGGYGEWVPVDTAWRVHRLRMEERPPIWRVAVNTSIFKKNNQGHPTRFGPPAWGLGEVLATPHLKN